MKARILTIALFLFAPVAVWAQSAVAPQNVLDKFSADYPDATGAKWEKEKANFAVEFVSLGEEMEVIYTPGAEVVQVERAIGMREVPDDVMDAFDEKFPGIEAEEITLIERNGETVYEMEFTENGREKEVLFDENGQYLSGGAEDEDGDED